jgi:inner membrane transporter RhtA
VELVAVRDRPPAEALTAGAPAGAGRGGFDRVPPVGLVLGAVTSVQIGSAVATTLFDRLGASGTAFLRVGLAALALLAVWRPRFRDHTRADLRTACLFGLTLAGMNLSFYEAIDRIPLGIAVTFEFCGPLGVAIAGSRRALDGFWVALAAAGILLFAQPWGAGGVDAGGAGYALLAGGFWAAYIVLNARAGRAFSDGSGLAIAMGVAGAVLIPAGLIGGGSELLDPGALAVGGAVAVLSSVIPYTLEFEALRRLPTNVFGVLMSLEPAFAAAAGFVVVGQGLSATDLAAIALVVTASAGAALQARGRVAAPLDA